MMPPTRLARIVLVRSPCAVETRIPIIPQEAASPADNLTTGRMPTCFGCRMRCWLIHRNLLSLPRVAVTRLRTLWRAPQDTRDTPPPLQPVRDAQLRRSYDFMEFAQSAGGFGVFDLDLLSGDISGTPLFFDLIGQKSRELTLTREQWVASIHPQDLEAVVIELGAAIDAGAKYQSEFRTVRLSGEVRWLAGRGQVLKDSEGYPARLIGTVADITERKELEEKLRYATESLNIAQTAAGLATFDFNFDLHTRICSGNFCALLGLPSSTK